MRRNIATREQHGSPYRLVTVVLIGAETVERPA